MVRPARRNTPPPLSSTPRLVRWFIRAAAWSIAAILALVVVANSSLLWEKGMASLVPAFELEVRGISTDLISMIAARKVRYAGSLPAAPLLRITGRDLFLAYDPLLRNRLAIDARSIAVESTLPPRAGGRTGEGGIPLLGSFRNVRILCPDLSIRVSWKDWSASCDTSKLTCAWPSSGTCTTMWDAEHLELIKEEDPVIAFRDLSVVGSFERNEGLDLPAILGGTIEAHFGSIDVDMETLSNLGNREKIAATGKFTGSGHAVLRGGGLDELGIALLSEGSGSVAVSKDFIDGYIQRIPSKVRQESMKIVLENLQDYAFNTGAIDIGLTDDVIEVVVDLDGQSGSRKVNFGFHDFIENGRLVPNPLFSTGR